MKITFLAPFANHSGGIRVIAIHADRLAAMGHDVTVIARREPQPGWKDYLRAFREGRMPRFPDTDTPFDRLAAKIRHIDHAGPITDADVPDGDAVIATWWETAYHAARLSPAKGRKFYFVQGHEVFYAPTNHLSAASYYLPLRKITIARWLADTMRDLYGDPDVAVIPNAVDHAQFFAPPRARQAVPTVGFIYGHLPVKGSDLAREATDLLRARWPDLRVVTFGGLPEHPDWPLPKGAAFTLRPAQTAIRDLYAACDVWMMPSRSEGFALPVLEAMACRCPVVSTRTGCGPEVIVEGVNGHLADIGDAAGLAAGLDAVLALDAAEWRAMSDAAHRTAAARSWDAATAEFERVLLAG